MRRWCCAKGWGMSVCSSGCDADCSDHLDLSILAEMKFYGDKKVAIALEYAEDVIISEKSIY